MSIILRNVQIPLFIKIESGCFSRIEHILHENHLQFQNALILSEAHILELGGNDIVHALGNPATALITKNSIAEGDRIAHEVREKQNDLIISIGGGRVLDMGKYIATRARVNYISVPTSPSNDGIASPVAVLQNADGVTESIPVNMPVGILVDPTMMSNVPENNILSGIGDMISNFSAIDDWKLAYTQGKDTYDDFAASISYSAAQLIFESSRSTNVNIASETFLEKLTHALILSGIAMNIAGNSRPCSGAEHKISHGLDALYPGRSMHGLQVFYATLLMMHEREQSVTEMVALGRSLGLPTTYTELGFTKEELVQAMLLAPDTRRDRYTILEERKFDAHSAAELIESYEASL